MIVQGVTAKGYGKQNVPWPNAIYLVSTSLLHPSEKGDSESCGVSVCKRFGKNHSHN